MNEDYVDVLIVGAGISGIGAAHHLQTHCPGHSYAILERRANIGGTWDLFKYPGIRSDSDMYTLGFSFRPWTNPEAIADGDSILEYLHDTAREGGIDENIRFRHAVTRATWSTADARWTVHATNGATGEPVHITCRFLYMCAGYYNYDEGHSPHFEGLERFGGRVVHPQHWTEDIEYANKRVVVIGSGATAVTLVPNLAGEAKHVTMLQRSPTYIVSAPGRDRIGNWLRSKLPDTAAYGITRWKNVLYGMGTYWFCRHYPERAKKFMVEQVRKTLGQDYDVETHFTPRYDPWDQRVCLAPGGDFFEAIKNGSASVVTDTIETFTEKGIRLSSGQELEADLVVTATGLKLQFLGGMQVEVDGRPLDLPNTLAYKGMMCSNVPNMALSIGYTNASWTLKADLTSEYVCRLLNHMEDKGYAYCCPRRNDPSLTEEPLLDFTSGYVQRNLDKFPKQGSFAPWKLHQNYAFDMMSLRHSKLEDGAMEFVVQTGTAGATRRRPSSRLTAQPGR